MQNSLYGWTKKHIQRKDYIILDKILNVHIEGISKIISANRPHFACFATLSVTIILSYIGKNTFSH